MRKVRAIGGSLALAVLLAAGAIRVPPLPRLGPLLDPIDGIWAVARSARLEREAKRAIPGLQDTVRVLYDDRGVPHIFAASPEDAVRALGYVVARDRLFQLELQSRATEGTLSELLGAAVLAPDRRQRALALAWSAERDFAALDTTSEIARLMTAYAQGVNAWIDGLGAADVPFEYKMLNARPRRWRAVYAYYLSKRMGYTLAYSRHELRRSQIEALVGRVAADALFPVHSPIQEPIVPLSGAPVFDATPLPPPVPRASLSGPGRFEGDAAGPISRSPATAHDRPWPPGVEVGAVGSNNWAVAPFRSASGYALLAGDPHLELTLPSIWYEAHLAVPGELDVYGVTIPGGPGVTIGFTRRVAWSFTNTEADVLDYFEETLDDPAAPTAYAVDGVWHPLTRRVERYRDPRGRVLAEDTVYLTHRGPLAWHGGLPLSIRWTVLDTTTEMAALARAARAASVDEWLSAMAAYRAPAQNGLVADVAGSIAIRSAGRLPIRGGDGRGTVVRDGSRSASDWRAYWPLEQLPYARDPAQGYLASANQEPRAPQTDTTYLGVDWPSPWRALRINALLRRDSAVTPEAMARYQTDPGSARADVFLPVFQEVAQAALSAVRGDDDLREAAGLLAQWDGRYTKDNQRAVLFELAMDELEDRTWDELALPAVDGRAGARRVATPAEAVLARLLHDPGNPWWDDRRTPDVVEDRDALIRASLTAALSRAKQLHGDPDGGGWRWERIRHARLSHLLGLNILSRLDVPVAGGSGTLNPSSGSGTFGASWRMVVELGPDLRAWSIYPGGQSGNPVSRWYDDRIGKWSDGELDPVLFPRTAGDLPAERVAATLVLVPEP